MRDPKTTRAIKLALIGDPTCRVLLGKAIAYRHAVEIVDPWSIGATAALRRVRAQMSAHARQAIAHARSRLPFYRQCVPHPEALCA